MPCKRQINSFNLPRLFSKLIIFIIGYLFLLVLPSSVQAVCSGTTSCLVGEFSANFDLVETNNGALVTITNAKPGKYCVGIDISYDGNSNAGLDTAVIEVKADGRGQLPLSGLSQGPHDVEVFANDPIVLKSKTFAGLCGGARVNLVSQPTATPTPTPAVAGCRNINDPCVDGVTPLCSSNTVCRDGVVVQTAGALNTPEAVEKTIDRSAKGCGVVGKQCCTFEPGAVPDVPDLELNAEASQFTGVMDMAKNLTKGLAEKIQEITFNDYNDLTNGRLCFDQSKPEITYSGGKKIVENKYLVSEKLFRIADSTPGNFDDNQKVEKESVTSCDCVPAEALCSEPFDDNGYNCNMRSLCKNVPGDYNDKNSQISACVDCMTKGKMWTVLGCIDIDLKSFVQNQLFGIGMGLAGLSAFLCIIYGSITLQISAGDPEKVKQAQELITSCITGLIVIIFSVFILRIIGVDLLQIPGLGG